MFIERSAICKHERRTRPNNHSGCDSVGRAVTFDARGQRFKSSHQQTFISDNNLFTINCIEKTKIKKTRPGMAKLKNT